MLLPARLACVSLLVALCGVARAQVPPPRPDIEPIVRPEAEATIVTRPPTRPITSIAAPWLSLGNYLEACTRSARPGVDCMAGLASGTGIIALVQWVPEGLPVSARRVDTYRILRVPRPGGRLPAAPGARPGPAVKRKLPAAGVVVSEGPFKGDAVSSSAIGASFKDGVLLTGVQAGQCFVVVVEARGTAGTVSAESPPVCIDASTRWGTETFLARRGARQQRARTDDSSNRDVGKILITAFDLRVGTQGAWGFWSLVNYDLTGVRFPLVKAELVVPSGAACIGRIGMVTPNWEHDNGPVSVNRPYDILQSRDVPRSEVLRQDVTAWLNTRGATVTGFQFSSGPADGTSCLSSVADLSLSVTALR